MSSFERSSEMMETALFDRLRSPVCLWNLSLEMNFKLGMREINLYIQDNKNTIRFNRRRFANEGRSGTIAMHGGSR